LADHHYADAPVDALVLDDEDLAALALGPAACLVVAAARARAGRVRAQMPALLHRRVVSQALESGGEIRNDLVDARDEKELASAVRIGRDAVAPSVGV